MVNADLAKPDLEALLQSVADGIVTIDESGRITFFNQAAERITGWPRDQALGRPADQVFALPEGHGVFLEHIPLSGGVHTVRVLTKKGNERKLAINIAPLGSPNQAGTRLALVLRDVSDEEAAKAEAEKLNQFKTEFTNMVTHELRAPVGGAQSLLRTLLRGLAGELNPQQIDILKRIEGRLDELLDLINDLLDLAASKTVAPQEAVKPIAVQPILQQIVDRFEPDAQAREVRLVVKLPDDVLKVQATEDGLEKIFGNLVGNAIKYTPMGGRVTLEARPDGSQLEISVADTGIGIPADEVDKIWEDFFRAKNAKRSGILGTGLGLSIVKELVDQYGGHIDVHSGEGQGTTFTLRLPLV